MKILCVLSRFAYGKPERGENYDYVNFIPALNRLGHEVEIFDSGERHRYADFADLNLALLAHIDSFRPNMIFCVLMHYEVWIETLDIIRSNSPAVIVNWGTDDSWKFAQASRYFAKHIDLHVTTDWATEQAAQPAGFSNICGSQWAASSDKFSETLPSSECRFDVSFIGSMYGYRKDWIAELRKGEISVSCFGHGTENGVVSAAEIPEIYRTSRISLNFSGAGQNSSGASGRQIKARTFEVPGAGGFLLSETAPCLQKYFDVEREIATFETADDLVTRVRYFLDRSHERDIIAKAGHARVVANHTYEHRFSDILQQVQPIIFRRASVQWSLSLTAIDQEVRRHRDNRFIAWVRPVLVGPLSLFFGARGVRAARRLLFELSWRFVGESTYRASGWPGRVFFRES